MFYKYHSLYQHSEWASSVKVDTGVISCLIAWNRKGNFKNYEKLIVLTFDEIYLSNKIAVDCKLEQIIGLHKTCQCIIVRSLFSNWKQSVHFNFGEPVIKSILLHVISRMYDIGNTVVRMIWYTTGNMRL